VAFPVGPIARINQLGPLRILAHVFISFTTCSSLLFTSLYFIHLALLHLLSLSFPFRTMSVFLPHIFFASVSYIQPASYDRCISLAKCSLESSISHSFKPWVYRPGKFPSSNLNDANTADRARVYIYILDGSSPVNTIRSHVLNHNILIVLLFYNCITPIMQHNDNSTMQHNTTILKQK
jgi:hypothetical protein